MCSLVMTSDATFQHPRGKPPRPILTGGERNIHMEVYFGFGSTEREGFEHFPISTAVQRESVIVFISSPSCSWPAALWMS